MDFVQSEILCAQRKFSQTNRQTDRQTDWQTVWQTDTDWLLDRQRQTDRHTDRFYFKTWQPKGSHISLSPQRPKGNKNFTSFGMAFLFSGCSTHLWFHLQTLKKWSCDDKFHDRLPDCVMNETLPLGKLLHSRSLLNWNFLARYNQRHVTEKSSTEAKSIAWIRFASNLVLLRNCNSIAANFGHLRRKLFIITWSLSWIRGWKQRTVR